MNDNLGNRMKEKFEDRSRFFLPRRCPVVIRVDGKAFHTLTRYMKKPFDPMFITCMNLTASTLCREIQGSVFAYVQSDEISVLLCDYKKRNSDAWFNYNIQKMVSVSASIATSTFTKYFETFKDQFEQGAKESFHRSRPIFDARCFSIPDMVEVANYFIWRQKDAERNSIQMLARSLYSHKELHQKSVSDMHDMLHTKGLNWNNLETRYKRGGLYYRSDENNVGSLECPIFSKTDFLQKNIPVHGYDL